MKKLLAILVLASLFLSGCGAQTDAGQTLSEKEAVDGKAVQAVEAVSVSDEELAEIESELEEIETVLEDLEPADQDFLVVDENTFE